MYNDCIATYLGCAIKIVKDFDGQTSSINMALVYRTKEQNNI